MLKRWCGIKKIEVYLLCEILTSKDTLQGQKKTVASLLNTGFKNNMYIYDPNPQKNEPRVTTR